MSQGSAQHVVMLFATGLIAVALALLARRDRRAAWIAPASRLLAALLVVSYAGFWTADLVQGQIAARADLPLDLSDLVVFVAAYALWTSGQLAFELTYFWGFTATVQALLTPSLSQGFPDYRWWWFAVAHGVVVVAALFLAWGLGRTPRCDAVLRVTGVSLAVALLVAAADLVLDANYMFLRRTPAASSLLDLLGPWPVYLVGATIVAVALFWLLDLPFRRRPERRGMHRRSRPALGH